MVQGQQIVIFISILASAFQAGYYNSLPLGIGLLGQYQYKMYFHYSSFTQTTVGNIIGIALGFCLAWPMGDKLGRKLGLIWSNGFLPLAIIFYLIELAAETGFLKVVSWIFVGLHAGAAFGLNLLYIFEISPRQSRGMAIIVYLLILRFAVYSMESISDFKGAEYFGIENGNLWFLLIALVPSGIHIFALTCSPESPGYTAVQNKDLEGAQFDLHLIEKSNKIPEAIYDFQSKLVHSSSSPLTLSVVLLLLSFIFQFGIAGFRSLHFSVNLLWYHQIPDIVSTVFMLISIGIVDRIRRTSFLFGTIAAIIIVTSILGIVIVFGDYGYFFARSTSYVPLGLLEGVDIGLCTVGTWMIPLIIILEMSDQESRARKLVLSHILTGLVILAVVLVIAAVRFAINSSFEFDPTPITIRDFFLVVGPVIFLLTRKIWKNLPETGGMTVEEISRQI